MIRSNQRFFNFLHIATDGILVFLSFVLAYLLRFAVLDGDLTVSGQVYFNISLLAVVLQLLIYGCFDLYSSQRKERLLKISFRIFYCNVIVCGILFIILFLAKLMHFSRMTLLLFFAIETTAIIVKRIALFRILYHLRSQGYNQKHIVVVGTGSLATAYVKEIEESPQLGYLLLGYVAGQKVKPSLYDPVSNLEYLGNFKDLETVLEFFKPDEVVVTLSAEDYPQIAGIIDTCEYCGVKMSMIPFYTEYFPSHPRVDFLHHLPMLHLRAIPLEHFGWATVKRLIDFFGSFFLIVVLSPVLFFTAIGVACSSKGPIIYSQTRVGKDKKEFKMYKFRSMVVNNEDSTAWSQKTDARKTKFGAMIRKCSIDELPQLFNVLRGEMSLVGPRPEIPYFVEQFKEDIPHYMVKHQIRPGLTGWAQIHGFRGDTSIVDRISYDLYYIEHWSLWMDIKILFLTLFKGIFNEEA